MTKGQKTKLRLLELAARIIGDEGIENLTVRSLANKAAVSPGLITRYFPKVTDIFPEVVKHVFEEVKKGLPPGETTDPAEWFVETARANFRFFVQENMHYNRCLFYAYIRAEFDRGAGLHFHQVVTSSILRGKIQAIRLAEKNGLKVDDEFASDFASAYLQRLDGAINHCCLLRTKKDRNEYIEVYLAAERRRVQQYLEYLRSMKSVV